VHNDPVLGFIPIDRPITTSISGAFDFTISTNVVFAFGKPRTRTLHGCALLRVARWRSTQAGMRGLPMARALSLRLGAFTITLKPTIVGKARASAWIVTYCPPTQKSAYGACDYAALK
jgi:hypothetical protein